MSSTHFQSFVYAPGTRNKAVFYIKRRNVSCTGFVVCLIFFEILQLVEFKPKPRRFRAVSLHAFKLRADVSPDLLCTVRESESAPASPVGMAYPEMVLVVVQSVKCLDFFTGQFDNIIKVSCKNRGPAHLLASVFEKWGVKLASDSLCCDRLGYHRYALSIGLQRNQQVCRMDIMLLSEFNDHAISEDWGVTGAQG